MLCLRIRLLPHLDPHHEQEDLLLPVPGIGRLPLRRRPGLRQQAGPRRLPRPVVWDHITGLLADPALIRAEIAKRLEQARTSDPATRQRQRLELELAKAATSITRMIEAFQEQLITIDELRARMPALRARETNLRGQVDALDAQLADRDAYLKLADDLEGFLAQLRASAATAHRRRTPARAAAAGQGRPHRTREDHHPAPHPGHGNGSSPGTNQADARPDTEGDHRGRLSIALGA